MTFLALLHQNNFHKTQYRIQIKYCHKLIDHVFVLYLYTECDWFIWSPLTHISFTLQKDCNIIKSPNYQYPHTSHAVYCFSKKFPFVMCKHFTVTIVLLLLSVTKTGIANIRPVMSLFGTVVKSNEIQINSSVEPQLHLYIVNNAEFWLSERF